MLSTDLTCLATVLLEVEENLSYETTREAGDEAETASAASNPEAQKAFLRSALSSLRLSMNTFLSRLKVGPTCTYLLILVTAFTRRELSRHLWH